MCINSFDGYVPSETNNNLSENDRVLLKHQTNAHENGIYIVQ